MFLSLVASPNFSVLCNIDHAQEKNLCVKTSISDTVFLSKQTNEKTKQKKGFGGDGNVYYLDCDDGKRE